MRPVYRTTRWLITTSLTVSLGFAGLFPQMMVGAESGTRLAAPEQPTKCCCGTQDGRCCGMGCCMARQAPAKEPSPCPNQADARNGHNNLPASTLVTALFGDSGETFGQRFRHSEAGANRSLSESSLQAKHVRIDA